MPKISYTKENKLLPGEVHYDISKSVLSFSDRNGDTVELPVKVLKSMNGGLYSDFYEEDVPLIGDIYFERNSGNFYVYNEDSLNLLFKGGSL